MVAHFQWPPFVRPLKVQENRWSYMLLWSWVRAGDGCASWVLFNCCFCEAHNFDNIRQSHHQRVFDGR